MIVGLHIPVGFCMPKVRVLKPNTNDVTLGCNGTTVYKKHQVRSWLLEHQKGCNGTTVHKKLPVVRQG